MKKIVFSIIVPVYNVEKYLDECLNSILNQSFKDYEVIVVNDGSTDNSYEILKKYKKNEKINIYTQNNHGLSYTRNVGVKKAKGDYLVFIDSDDYIEKDYLLKISKVIDLKPEVIKNEFTILDSDLHRIDNYICDITSAQSVLKDLINRKITFEPACMYVVNREFWKLNNFEFSIGRYHEDFGLIPLILLKTNKFISIDNSGYIYRQSEDSIMRNMDYKKNKKKAYDMLYFFDNYINEINNNIFKSAEDLKYFKSYIANALLLKLDMLNKFDRKEFIKELKSREVVSMLLSDTFKRKMKKIYYILKLV